MKTKVNHKLSYKNLVFVSSLAGLMGFMAIPSWTRQRDEDRVVNAKRHAEVLGYQVVEIYREASRNTRQQVVTGSSRAPASAAPVELDTLNFRDAGSIGNDPWGQPYRYKLLSVQSEQMKVQIWSAGPNKLFETEDKPGVAAESYIGDDVGVVLSMSQKPAE